VRWRYGLAPPDVAVPALRVQARLLRGRAAVALALRAEPAIIAAPVSLQEQSEERSFDAVSGAGAAVRLEGVRKTYGDVVAVDDVDLEIRQGEFFTLLGPSGSGKTTTLRVIAGFEPPDAGRVFLGGVDVTNTPPYARDVNTVFQDYALFPHMTVAENVGYGLRVKGVRRGERQQRVESVLERMRLKGLGKRKPVQLSGGQRQRVALARALVNRPDVLLLDEPLGALDLKLRQEMQLFLKSLQQDLGITFVYVTHDQDEALTMSDRLAVFDRGRIVQLGEPADVYERPASAFVAGFVGVSNVVERDGRRFAVRPEKIRMTDGGATPARGAHAESGRIRDVVYAGMVTRYVVELDRGGELQVVRQNLETSSAEALDAKGRPVLLEWRPEHSLELDRAGDTEGER
jgi:putative spermidine/putrescine transport system ATP-binding protein